jgi:hypothetical protein
MKLLNMKRTMKMDRGKMIKVPVNVPTKMNKKTRIRANAKLNMDEAERESDYECGHESHDEREEE